MTKIRALAFLLAKLVLFCNTGVGGEGREKERERERERREGGLRGEGGAVNCGVGGGRGYCSGQRGPLCRHKDLITEAGVGAGPKG